MQPSVGMRKIAAMTAVVAVLVLLGLAACGGSQTPGGGPKTQQTGPAGASTTAPPTTALPTTGSSGTAATSPASTGGRTFTLDELAQFDGTKGNPAYVAVDGVVYDVSASAKWVQGQHTACNLGAMAGQDLSELITKAPASMRGLLEKMPVVGTLARP